jgi:hypothetical protein
MTTAYQLLSLVAKYSDIANRFDFHYGHAVAFAYCWKLAPSGRARWVATDAVEG